MPGGSGYGRGGEQQGGGYGERHEGYGDGDAPRVTVALLPHRHIAFVTFPTERECTEVMEQRQGVRLHGRVVKLNYGKSRERGVGEEGGQERGRDGGGYGESGEGGRGAGGGGQEKMNPTNVLWVGRLVEEVHTHEVVRGFFENWEGFMSTAMPDRTKGFAFINFLSVDHAVGAQARLREEFDNKIAEIEVKVRFGNTMYNPPAGENGNARIMPSEKSEDLSVSDSRALLPIPQERSEDYTGTEADWRSDVSHELPPPSNPFPAPGAQDAAMPNEESTRDAGYLDYYNELCDPKEQFGRNQVDRICELVDAVRRANGKEALGIYLTKRRLFSSYIIDTIALRLSHQYQKDTHKKLLVYYAVLEAFARIPPHQRYDLGAEIAERMVKLTEVVLENQCETGQLYIHEALNCVLAYFDASVQKALQQIFPSVTQTEEITSAAPANENYAAVDDIDSDSVEKGGEDSYQQKSVEPSTENVT